MKYAIRVEETRGKTYIIEADSLEEAIEKVDVHSYKIDLENEEYETEIFASPFAYNDGIATEDQIKDCEVFE